MDSKTKTSIGSTILYGIWPINPNNPGEAIQTSIALEESGVDWFPRGPRILVRVADMIKIWDRGELKISPVYRKTTGPGGLIFSKDFEITILRPGYARISLLSGRGSIELEDYRVTSWSGFKDRSVMLKCMKEFFDYNE
jgi:hypothetical protein